MLLLSETLMSGAGAQRATSRESVEIMSAIRRVEYEVLGGRAWGKPRSAGHWF